MPLLQSLKLKARLDAGLLAVSDLDVGWGGGHSTGTVGLDLRQHPPRSEAQLETRGVRIEALFPASDEKQRITGVLRGRSVLKATGDDVEALRASLSGNGLGHALGRNDPEPARCADGPRRSAR